MLTVGPACRQSASPPAASDPNASESPAKTKNEAKPSSSPLNNLVGALGIGAEMPLPDGLVPFPTELTLAQDAMDVRRDLVHLLAGDDDRGPGRQIGREHAAEPFDDGTGIPPGKQTQPADEGNVLAGKRMTG